MKIIEKNPLISIIIPFYNRKKRLVQTLNSIACQTYSPIELILVDNGSTDRSLSVCETFQAINNHEGFQVILLQELKKGANAARNAGFRASSGNYLFFFDSDDRLYPESLATVVSNLSIFSFPEIIIFPFKVRFPNDHFANRPHRFTSNPAYQLFDPTILTNNVCIRQDLALKNGLWDETLQRWQDLEYGFRLLLNAKNVYWIKGKPLYEVFTHKNSISGNTYSLDHKILFASLSKIQDIINGLPSGNKRDKIQRALCFKICSMAAQIRHENNKELSKKYLTEALNKLPANKRHFSQLILKIYYLYSGHGGRGFWRLAEKTL
jgi:glycosyltransferase involved in cell wall biosynthesis